MASVRDYFYHWQKDKMLPATWMTYNNLVQMGAHNELEMRLRFEHDVKKMIFELKVDVLKRIEGAFDERRDR